MGVCAAVRAAAQPVPARIELAGTVRLEGSGPGDFPVHLPQPVSFSVFATATGPKADVAVRGNGRVIGFLLHQDGDWNTVIAHVEQYGFCTTPGCTPSAPRYNGGVYDPRTGDQVTGTLPAGNYHLYFIADAAPAAVTLHFNGLSGSRVLHPSGPAPVEVLTAPTTVSLPPRLAGPMDYAAGVTRHTPAGAATVMAMWTDSSVRARLAYIASAR